MSDERTFSGYGCEVEWDGDLLTMRGTSRATHFALAGKGHPEDVEVLPEDIASVDLKDASRLTNGNLVIRTAAGAKYQLHFRRKQAEDFRRLAEALGA